MSALQIGGLVARHRSGARWHAVESVIADDAITRCGRRMADTRPGEGYPLVTDDSGIRPGGLTACRQCFPEARA